MEPTAEHARIGSVGDYLTLGPILEVDEFGWGHMELRARSGRFSAEIVCHTSPHDLRALSTILRAQHAQTTLQQSWNSFGGELRLEFSGDIRGGVCVAIKLADIGECERVLSYNLDIDQSYLPALIEQLSQIIASMPEATT
ncbi:WapI family immunity protein [Bosea sp. NPDC055594]